MKAQEATGAPGSASRPAPLSAESTAADDGQEFDEGHDKFLYRGSKHVQKLNAATCHSLRFQRRWSSTCHDVWSMLCWGQCLGTNKWMQGHHETQRQMLVVVQYDGSSLTRRVRMPECSQSCYSPISCLRGLMHFVLFSVSGRGCTGVATHSMAALRSGG